MQIIIIAASILFGAICSPAVLAATSAAVKLINNLV
jgi:hypothetical protein